MGTAIVLSIRFLVGMLHIRDRITLCPKANHQRDSLAVVAVRGFALLSFRDRCAGHTLGKIAFPQDSYTFAQGVAPESEGFRWSPADCG